MRRLAVIVAMIFLLVLAETPALASMSTSEVGTFDRLLAYSTGLFNENEAGLLGLALPGLMQFRRGNILEGLIQVGIEVGTLMFMFRWEEEQTGGDTFRELKVNWWMVAVLLMNHLYSGVTTYLWSQSENAQLRLELDVDRIILGIQF